MQIRFLDAKTPELFDVAHGRHVKPMSDVHKDIIRD